MKEQDKRDKALIALGLLERITYNKAHVLSRSDAERIIGISEAITGLQTLIRNDSELAVEAIYEIERAASLIRDAESNLVANPYLDKFPKS